MNRTLRTLLLVSAALSSVALAKEERLGWLVEEPSGLIVEELASPAVVKTVSDPMTVELDGGRRLAFDANSAAHLERLPSGVVRVRVLSGLVSTKDDHGTRRTAGARSVFHVDDVEPPVDERVPARPESDDRQPRRTGRVSVEREVGDHR
jgi:hypothetical protein